MERPIRGLMRITLPAPFPAPSLSFTSPPPSSRRPGPLLGVSPLNPAAPSLKQILILGADATGRLRRLGSNLGARGPHCICQQLCWVHMLGALLGPPELKLGLFRGYVGACLCWPILKFCWSYVGDGSMLGPSSPI